jgi:hypothetical protein
MSYFQNVLLSFFIAFFSTFLFNYFYPLITMMSLIGFGAFIFFIVQFYLKLGNDIPLKELIVIIALLQWIIAPILSYHFYTKSEFYYMIIDEERYMSYNIPAVFSFSLGLFISFVRKKYSDNYQIKVLGATNQEEYRKKGVFLFIVGLISTFIVGFPIPPSLRFLLLLFTYLSYVGSFYLYRSNVSFKWVWLCIAFLPTLFSASQNTTFHEMFLWGGFIIIMYTYINKSSPFVKTSLIVTSITIVVLISSVKQEFREKIEAVETQSKSESAKELVGLINQQIADTKKPSNEDFRQTFVDRMNQGWIIARVMYVVPDYEPFADGETIAEGLKAAILPRILAPNKQIAGGTTNFERFTGLKLIGTSMNLGIIGEAYGNYGEQGGVIFMFIYGLFFNIVFHILRTRALIMEEYLLWIPFLFLYAVKAEDDFGTSLNYFTKSTIVMVAFIWISNKVMGSIKTND